MMGIRRNRTNDGPYVLWGDRQLAVIVSYGSSRQYVVTRSAEDIKDLLDRYKAGYVIVENGMAMAKDFMEYRIFMESVRENNLFREVARFPIRTNYRRLGSELIIYEYDYKETKESEVLKIPLPTLKENLEIPFH